MEIEKYNTIKVRIDTKMEFDKLQFDLRLKGIKRDQDQLVNMLMDTFKEYNRRNLK